MKFISTFIQIILIAQYANLAYAEPSCSTRFKQLQKENETVILNGGIWGYFEKDSKLRKRSVDALQLDSRINKVIFVLGYLCETQNGIPFVDAGQALEGDPIKETHFFSDAHFTPLGHQRVAAFLLPHLDF